MFVLRLVRVSFCICRGCKGSRGTEVCLRVTSEGQIEETSGHGIVIVHARPLSLVTANVTAVYSYILPAFASQSIVHFWRLLHQRSLLDNETTVARTLLMVVKDITVVAMMSSLSLLIWSNLVAVSSISKWHFLVSLTCEGLHSLVSSLRLFLFPPSCRVFSGTAAILDRCSGHFSRQTNDQSDRSPIFISTGKGGQTPASCKVLN